MLESPPSANDRAYAESAPRSDRGDLAQDAEHVDPPDLVTFARVWNVFVKTLGRLLWWVASSCSGLAAPVPRLWSARFTSESNTSTPPIAESTPRRRAVSTKFASLVTCVNKGSNTNDATPRRSFRVSSVSDPPDLYMSSSRSISIDSASVIAGTSVVTSRREPGASPNPRRFSLETAANAPQLKYRKYNNWHAGTILRKRVSLEVTCTFRNYSGQSANS